MPDGRSLGRGGNGNRVRHDRSNSIVPTVAVLTVAVLTVAESTVAESVAKSILSCSGDRIDHTKPITVSL